LILSVIVHFGAKNKNLELLFFSSTFLNKFQLKSREREKNQQFKIKKKKSIQKREQ